MSGQPFSGKVRRHTYSMAQLRASAQDKADRNPHEVHEGEGPCIHYEFERDWHEGDFEAYRQIANGWVDWPIDMLPDDARVVSFAELAIELSMHPRGFALLTGADRNAAGLENFRLSGYGDHIGGAFSFCVNGMTYTAFEDSGDDYRSSMARMVEREGNHCHNVFEPCALLPQFCRSRAEWASDDDLARDPTLWRKVPPADERAGHADILELVDPHSGQAALSVGTRRSEDYYPSFTGHVDPIVLTRARSRGIAESFALSDELHENIVGGSAAPQPKRRL